MQIPRKNKKRFNPNKSKTSVSFIDRVSWFQGFFFFLIFIVFLLLSLFPCLVYSYLIQMCSFSSIFLISFKDVCLEPHLSNVSNVPIFVSTTSYFITLKKINNNQVYIRACIKKEKNTKKINKNKNKKHTYTRKHSFTRSHLYTKTHLHINILTHKDTREDKEEE